MSIVQHLDYINPFSQTDRLQKTLHLVVAAAALVAVGYAFSRLSYSKMIMTAVALVGAAAVYAYNNYRKFQTQPNKVSDKDVAEICDTMCDDISAMCELTAIKRLKAYITFAIKDGNLINNDLFIPLTSFPLSKQFLSGRLKKQIDNVFWQLKKQYNDDEIVISMELLTVFQNENELFYVNINPTSTHCVEMQPKKFISNNEKSIKNLLADIHCRDMKDHKNQIDSDGHIKECV